jgi:hypothetical protein
MINTSYFSISNKADDLCLEIIQLEGMGDCDITLRKTNDYPWETLWTGTLLELRDRLAKKSALATRLDALIITETLEEK